ncbi:TetR/AcrR family transcriptional regulator [Rufibacter sediminis]|uniref:TetR/AcrR family transcriptional regulator n=1 Tax=Rufibacter sediminis TaxID=2762756 RepID=A0ABR6VSW0_9BACT|nr:TetR/AcrR family transcriptional regulator [Rufibacter sediminis]MBC3540254.1 TetR/AcrR family transcriptional regulator [Rufibacter sediminis]
MARTKVFDEDLILNKAMHLFWEKGYTATTAQDLVDRLGISRSSLYDTYGDKHSLFVRALKKYRLERIDHVIQEAATAPDVEKYLRDMFEYVKNEALQENYARGCFIVNSAVELAPCDPEVATIVQSITQDMEDAACNAIQRGQEQGVFTTQFSALSLSRFFLNTLNGLRVTVKVETRKQAFDDIINVCLAALKA